MGKVLLILLDYFTVYIILEEIFSQQETIKLWDNFTLYLPVK